MHRNNNENGDISNILIYGDSNTKHIDLSNSYTECTRIATYRIFDIDVNKCSGFKTIWIHCGINNLKHRNGKHDKAIHVVFKLLLSKLDRIRAVNPGARVILSPILPTGITALTERASYFNSLIFAVKIPWLLELKFSSFLNSYGNFDSVYRCRTNPADRIHHGYHVINALCKIHFIQVLHLLLHFSYTLDTHSLHLCYILVTHLLHPLLHICNTRFTHLLHPLLHLRFTVVTLIFTILMHPYLVVFYPVIVLWHFVLWHFVRIPNQNCM